MHSSAKYLPTSSAQCLSAALREYGLRVTSHNSDNSSHSGVATAMALQTDSFESEVRRSGATHAEEVVLPG